MKPLPPIVLTNHTVLGRYDYSIGTNIFFEDGDHETVKKSPFEKETPINLQYVAKETKVLRMTKLCAKMPLINDVLEPKQMKRFVPKEGYKDILNKWSKGLLNVDNYFVNLDTIVEHKKEVAEQSITVTENKGNLNQDTQSDAKDKPQLDSKTLQIKKDQTNDCVKKEMANIVPRIISKDAIQEKYNQLQQLSKQPLKSKLGIEIPHFEQVHMSKNKSRHVIKNTLLHDTELEEINLRVRDDTIEDFVNIPNSIQDGVISSITHTHNLGNKDKVNVLSPSNFKNFTPFMKLIVLKDFLKSEEEEVSKMCEEELQEEDEYGWNPRERCELLQSLIEELQFFIEARMSSAIGKSESDDEKNDIEDDVEKIDIKNAS